MHGAPCEVQFLSSYRLHDHLWTMAIEMLSVISLLLYLFHICQGVCIGLSEVMASAGKSQLLSFMDDLIPTIRTALCDKLVLYFGLICSIGA